MKESNAILNNIVPFSALKYCKIGIDAVLRDTFFEEYFWWSLPIQLEKLLCISN